ncbi:MAG: type II secretion system F family protein [Candidatus Micrarchaeota archaeon]|nr:type II secretion system F family protein [Candidatus Micrarchaeota archaeon]
MLFDKKKRTITVEGKTIELQPKPKGIGGLFSRKPSAKQPAQQPQKQVQPPAAPAPPKPPEKPVQQRQAPGLFGGPSTRTITVDNRTITLQPKPGKGLGGIFSPKPKAPPAQQPKPAVAAQPVQQKPAAPKPAGEGFHLFGAKPQQPKPSMPATQPAQQPKPSGIHLFEKKRTITIEGKTIELQPKPSKGLGGIFAPKPKVAQPKPAPQVPAPAIPVAKPVQQAGQGIHIFGSKPAQPKPPTAVAQAPLPKPAPVPAKPHGEGFHLFGAKPAQPKPMTIAYPQPKPAPVQKPAGEGFHLFGAKPQQPKPVTVPKPAPQQMAAAARPQRPEFHLFQKPAPKPVQPQQVQQPRPATPTLMPSAQQQRPAAPQQPGAARPGAYGKPSAWRLYVEGIGNKRKGLEQVLKEQKIATSLYDFVERMIIISAMLAAVIGIVIILLFVNTGQNPVLGVVFGAVIAFAVFQMALTNFLSYPEHRTKVSTKNIERDILFASRDMIISLRSGMPLFNAITSVSTGYGEASKEFAKIVEKVQLGTPLEEALDLTIAQTQSDSFRRIMLQASVSIKAGADVVSALQSVIDQLSQERIIELRRYGQKLNAIAMFYMLFGVILPSMGIAVLTILTTFIAIFQVNATVLEFAVVGIIFLQVMFLVLIQNSRPSYSM